MLFIIIIYFFIGFISDIFLNVLSRQTYAPASIQALRVYFLRKSSFKSPFIVDIISAINAGLTIVAVLLVTMLLSFLLFHFWHPRTLTEFWKFMLLAFPIGYIADIIIYQTELFGSTLNPFYKIAGAGFWGAAAFLFSIALSYIVLKSI